MSRTTIIMPGRCQNVMLTNMYRAALASCKASCDAHVLFMDNTGTPEGYVIKAFCDTLGYSYYQFDFPSPYCNAKWWNHGVSITESEFICYANADLIFFPGWLERLLWHWQRNNWNYHSMHPYSWSPTENNMNYKSKDAPRNECVSCDHPGAYAGLFRRSEGYVWDERYFCAEDDCDYWMWLKANQRMAGVCYDARVDHLCGCVQMFKGDTGDSNLPDGTNAKALSAQRFKEKWGIK